MRIRFYKFFCVVVSVVIALGTQCCTLNDCQYVYADYDEDNLIDMDEEFEAYYIDPERIELKEGRKRKITMYDGDDNPYKNVQYDSSDESVATVSDNGVVRAVGAGTATISVLILDSLAEERTCKVKVTKNVPSYTKINKLLKKYDNKEKYRLYTEVVKGKHSHIECAYYEDHDDSKIETKNFACSLYLWPTIELVKTSKGSVLKHQYAGYFIWIDTDYDSSVALDYMLVKAGNKRVKFTDLRNNVEDIHRGNGVYEHVNRFTVTVSDSNAKNTKKLNTLMNMLKSGSCEMKVMSEDSMWYTTGVLENVVSSTWLDAAKIYKKLKKMY